MFANTPKNLMPFVSLNPSTGRPYTRNLNRIFNRATRKVGLRVSRNEFERRHFAMQVLEAGLDKSMVSYLFRHQDPRRIDPCAESRTKPLKGALDKDQGFNGRASHLTAIPGGLLEKLAERVGFEPTCPAVNGTSRFRVDPVTTTSVPLRMVSGFLLRSRKKS